MDENPRKFEFNGWQFEVGVWTWSDVAPVTVNVTGPRGAVVTVGSFGEPDHASEVCFEVQDKERSRGYGDGDCAVDRYVPGAVVVKAVQEYEAGMEVWRVAKAGTSS